VTPVYDAERKSRAYYDGWARWFDWANHGAALLHGVSQNRERRKAVDRLAIGQNARVLEVSVGTGTNVPLIAERLGTGDRVVGLDISRQMLRACREKLQARGIQAALVEGEAAHLPFADGAFDAVLHHGGFAEFGDKKGAVEEMMRVARPGAKIVICDPGIDPDRKQPIMSRLMLRMQPAYAHSPPLDVIPPAASGVQVSWFHGRAWYLIEFAKP
jgi:ubiquinone/menaquinone biosynthesis C-methylase UbiE